MPAGDAPPPSGRRHIRELAVAELRRFLVMFLYLWLLLGLFAVHEDVVLREHSIGYAFHGFALVNALVLGKVMLIAEDLRLGQRLWHGPPIVRIVLDSLLLAVLFILVHVLEHVASGLYGGETLAQSIPAIGGGGMQGLVCVALILFVALIPFFAFRDLARAIGPDRIKAILLGRSPLPEP